MSWKGIIDTNFCKCNDWMRKEAAKMKSGKKWFSDGVLSILAYGTNKDSAKFYFRHSETKQRTAMYPVKRLDFFPGGDIKLADVWKEARKLSGEKPAAKTNLVMTLEEALQKFLDRVELRGSAAADIERTIRSYAPEWLSLPVSKIDSDLVSAKLAEIKSPKGKGTQKVADKFARYLRTVLIKTDDTGEMFTLASNPVSIPQKNIIGKIEYTRPAICIEDHEIAAILNFSRSDCTFKRNGRTGDPDAMRWQKFLGLKFALLSGLRIGDISGSKLSPKTAIRDDQIEGDFIKKKKGEAQKTTRPHRLPISRQMHAIINEARAMRDNDVDTLRKSFGWTKAQLDDLGSHKFPTDVIFPSLTDLDGSHYSQSTHLVRPAMILMKSEKLLKAETRIHPESGDELDEKSFIKPHDLRATFATMAFNAGVDELQIARFLNHAISIGGQNQTAKYMTAHKLNDQKQLDAMQSVSDHLFKIAKRHRASHLAVVK